MLQAVSTLVLLRWLGRVPTEGLTAAPQTRRGLFALVVVLALLALFPVGLTGLIVLLLVGVAALAAVLITLRSRPSRRAVLWALTLGLVATAGGLIEWSASGRSSDLAIALAQTPLVLVTLLAGWAIAHRTGWEEVGIGPSTFLSEGTARSLRDFGLGFVLAVPWALGNIATGPFEEDNVQAGWQVLAALHPGVAEEAWGRVFVIAALYWAFSRYARAHPAVLAAAVLGTYWFAFLHAPFNPVAMVLLGTVQVLPMTFLWLRRGLEVAIGFHVCADLVRFCASYLAVRDVWFS
jgi:hypothetical protein